MSTYKYIYILDSGAYGGGGEALYQLGCDLLDKGIDVQIVQLDSRKSIPIKFNKYVSKGLEIISPDRILDKEDNLLIVPEANTGFLFDYIKIKKAIWWLSFDNSDCFFHWNKTEKFISNLWNQKKVNFWLLKQFAHNLFFHHRLHFNLNEAINLSGSHYAQKCLLERYGIKSIPFIHSIGRDFLDAGMYVSQENRNNVVLYNPAKPSALTKYLIRRGKFKYVPIQGMSFKELLDLFRSSKLYIDFGNFPGPERLPKETVFNGVNILVWKHNAAATDDVCIPDTFKVDPDADIQSIENKIAEMLHNYDRDFSSFSSFRNMIMCMEDNYYKQLDNIFD